LRIIDEDRINQAVESFKLMLKLETLFGKTFLDIGSGCAGDSGKRFVAHYINPSIK
jgi:hypothetical protein